RVKRRTRSAAGAAPRVVKTLEDTPFYSRSVVRSRLFGADRIGVHESLSGPRLRNPAVKMLLPFRMPRLA
ncbi:MAG: carotenoid 1,2-hydratase, partial [Pseudomonadota bacterium]